MIARIRAILWQWCLKLPPVMLVYRTVAELANDDATHMAAGVAYYSILSFFPLAIALLAVLTPLIPEGQMEDALHNFLQTYLPGAGEAFHDTLEGASALTGVVGVLSVIGMVWTSSAIFGAVSRAVNRAWDVHQDRPFYIDKVRHIAMALSVGLLFLLSVAATSYLQFLDSFHEHTIWVPQVLEEAGAQTLVRLLPTVLSLGIFLMIYKLVPNTTTQWRYIWPGALLAAIGFEIAKNLFVVYLDHFAHFERVYGSLGSVVVLMLWTYVSSLILIIGAEFASEYERMRLGIERGRAVPASARRRR